MGNGTSELKGVNSDAVSLAEGILWMTTKVHVHIMYLRINSALIQ